CARDRAYRRGLGHCNDYSTFDYW
nr:immunoglobulin heavy chain junction region [Macaca mulatta]